MLGSSDELNMVQMNMTGRDVSVGKQLAHALMERIHKAGGI